MTADLIECVRTRGADLLPLGATLRVLWPERLEPATIEELRREKPAVLRALEAERLAVAIVAQHFLREGRFPPEPSPCAYDCRHSRDRCRRCGASWLEHYPEPR